MRTVCVAEVGPPVGPASSHVLVPAGQGGLGLAFCGHAEILRLMQEDYGETPIAPLCAWLFTAGDLRGGETRSSRMIEYAMSKAKCEKERRNSSYLDIGDSLLDIGCWF